MAQTSLTSSLIAAILTRLRHDTVQTNRQRQGLPQLCHQYSPHWRADYGRWLRDGWEGHCRPASSYHWALRIYPWPYWPMTILTHDHTDLPEISLKQIEHLFEHYKNLEPDKVVKIWGWKNADTASEMITAAIARYRALKLTIDQKHCCNRVAYPL